MAAPDAKIDYLDQRALVGAVGEDAEGIARHRAIVAGALHGVAEGVLLGDQALRLGEVGVGLLLAFQGAAPEFALGFGRPARPAG